MFILINHYICSVSVILMYKIWKITSKAKL